MRRRLLPIGSFAARGRLSVKALRHYDELGLLLPRHVDLRTGYRYYDPSQAPRALAIALLRSLDVPLAAIRDVLAAESGDAVAAVLERERERRAREVARAEGALRAIERLLRGRSLFPYAVTLRDEPAQTVLAVEARAAADEHVAVGTALVAALRARLARLGRAVTGPIMCLLPPSPDDRLTLVMCTPVADAPARERVLTLPAATVAVTRHVGPYEEIGLADLTLHAWAEERGLEPSGPIRELYRNDPAAVAPEALVTDVMLPVTPPSARTPGGAAGRR